MTNDISDFMSWFIGQVVDMFGEIYSILDSITFAGTSLLKVLLTILILGSLLGVILTIGKSADFIGSRSDRISSRKDSFEREQQRKREKGESSWI